MAAGACRWVGSTCRFCLPVSHGWPTWAAPIGWCCMLVMSNIGCRWQTGGPCASSLLYLTCADLLLLLRQSSWLLLRLDLLWLPAKAGPACSAELFDRIAVAMWQPCKSSQSGAALEAAEVDWKGRCAESERLLGLV